MEASHGIDGIIGLELWGCTEAWRSADDEDGVTEKGEPRHESPAPSVGPSARAYPSSGG